MPGESGECSESLELEGDVGGVEAGVRGQGDMDGECLVRPG